MTEKSKRVDYEMKYIGWNIGATRVERHETKGGIEILELKIDGVDVLKQLEKAEGLMGEIKKKGRWVIASTGPAREEDFEDINSCSEALSEWIMENGVISLSEIYDEARRRWESKMPTSRLQRLITLALKKGLENV